MPSDPASQKRKLSPSLNQSDSDYKSPNNMDKDQLDRMENAIENLTNLVNQVVTDFSQIKASIINMQADISSLNARLLSTETHMKETQKDTKELKRKSETTEVDLNAITIIHQKQTSAINALEQKVHASKVLVHHIPKEIDLNRALNDIGKWCGADLSRKFVRSAHFFNANKAKCAQIEFWNSQIKSEFNARVKVKRSNPDGSFLPTLCEDIFNLEPQSTSRGVQVQFRHPMTEINRMIFNEARRHRDVFKFIWIGANGHVLVKQNEKSNAAVLHTVEDIATVIKEINNSKKSAKSH